MRHEGTNEGTKSVGTLTAIDVKNARPGRHADGQDLYLLVKPSGSKSVLRTNARSRRDPRALTLSKELLRLYQAKDLKPEWQPLLRDLDRLQETTVEKDCKRITTRTHVTGQVGSVFQAASSLSARAGANSPPDPHQTLKM